MFAVIVHKCHVTECNTRGTCYPLTRINNAYKQRLIFCLEHPNFIPGQRNNTLRFCVRYLFGLPKECRVICIHRTLPISLNGMHSDDQPRSTVELHCSISCNRNFQVPIALMNIRKHLSQKTCNL